MIGSVTVDGTPIAGGVMPSFVSLSDQDLADALDYIVSLDDSGKLHVEGGRVQAGGHGKGPRGQAPLARPGTSAARRRDGRREPLAFGVLRDEWKRAL